ncbi:MAG: HEAT repeat domain-containing protein, partial [Actinomycetota bacterium]|nr:HEAT repeat domain-containing protein [Actinomycetota bacterium]
KTLIKRGPDSVPALLGELQASDADVRNFACVALGQIGDSRAVEPLCATSTDDSDDNVRYTALEALGRIGDARATAALITHLDEEPWLAAVAAESLGLIGGADALQALIGKLTEDPVGLVAAESLGMLDDPRALLPLVQTASRCSPLLGVPALRSVGRIVGSASTGTAAVIDIIRPIATEMANATLMESLDMALKEPDESKEWALNAAVWLAPVELASSVCGAADAPEHAPLAVDFLVQQFDAVRSEVTRAAASDRPSVRAVAAMAIERGGDERDLPIIIELLHDENQSVSIAAIEALARVGGIDEAERLIRLFHSGIDEVVFAAADALGVLGVADLTEDLIDLAENGGPVVRRAVARALCAAQPDADDADITRC